MNPSTLTFLRSTTFVLYLSYLLQILATPLSSTSLFNEPPLPPCGLITALSTTANHILLPLSHWKPSSQDQNKNQNQNWLIPTDTCWSQPFPANSLVCEASTQVLMSVVDNSKTQPFPSESEICSVNATYEFKSNLSDSNREPVRMVTRGFTRKVFDAVPSRHVSSRCLGCRYSGHSVQLSRRFAKVSGVEEGDVVGESRWSGFVNAVGFDAEIGVKVTADDELLCSQVFVQPVFALDLICLQVGHLIIDILEPLYYAMIDTYGRVNRDALLFIDIADQKTATQTMPAALSRDVFYRDSMFKLLRLFTKHTIHSKRVLERLTTTRDEGIDKGGLCFEDLHLQLDIQDTFSVSQMRPVTDRSRRDRYQGLQTFILEGLGVTPSQNLGPLTVGIVERRSKRTLKNFANLTRIAGEVFGSEVERIRLEELSFTEQVRTMQGLDVFISQQGTGFHNVLFMRPGTTVVLIMQPGWCRFHWQFSDQALLLDIHVVLLCQDNMPEARRFGRDYLQDEASGALLPVRSTLRWHKKGFLQGPWHSKSIDVKVDEELFARAVGVARDFSEQESVFPAKIHTIAAQAIDSPTRQRTIRPQDVRPFLSLDDSSLKQAMISTIPEVVVNNHEKVSLTGLEEMRLCVGYAEGHATKYCQNFSLFEFDTLDVTIETSVLLKLWVEDDENAGPPTFVLLPQQPELIKDISSALVGHSFTIPFQTSQKAISVTFHSDSVWETVQLLWSAACLEHRLTDEQCTQVVASGWKLLMDDYLAIQAALPPRQSYPSVARPFVFMHLEKTGGACFGTMLARTSNQWKAVIPCHGGVDCYTFDYGNKSVDITDAVVMGGHFNWGFWETQAIPPRHDASCFTLTRHPVSRVISFYYERVYSFTKRMLNDLTVQELVHLLENFHGSGFGKWRDEGMSNAACKMLSGARIFTGRTPADHFPEASWSFEKASPRLASCLVGMQEDWEKSMDMVAFWFPWMATTVAQGCSPQEKNMRNWVVETKETLKDDLKEAILAFNACDMKLYVQATAQFRRQKQFLSLRSLS